MSDDEGPVEVLIDDVDVGEVGKELAGMRHLGVGRQLSRKAAGRISNS